MVKIRSIICVLSIAWLGDLEARTDSHAAAFDRLWNSMRDHYAYLEESTTDWDQVREHFQPLFVAAKDDAEFVELLESMFDELRDSHIQLNRNVESSYRLVPSGSDLMARVDGDAAILTHVRAGSAAETAGARVGMRVVSIQGRSIAQAIESRLGVCRKTVSEDDRAWALRSALAGRRNADRVLEVESGGERHTLRIVGFHRPSTTVLLEWQRLDDDIGYIRIHDSLGASLLVPFFDDALTALADTRALILDLRDTPGGGNTTVARALLGRFIDREQPYQKHELASEMRLYGVRRSWLELVSPRGPKTYSQPVAVLVDPWTGSMGEGMAIAFDAMARGTVVGCEMARLRGATSSFDLGIDGIVAWFPTERLFHVDGTPRHEYTPTHYVDPLAPEHRDHRDPCLRFARQLLENQLSR